MIQGSSVESVHWGELRAPEFEVHEIKSSNWTTCGTATLGLLTGFEPSRIEKYCPRPRIGWSTRAVSNYLLKRGYTVVEVTRKNVTNVGWMACPLVSDHVILINAELNTEEASWFILHKDVLWHNDYVEHSFNPLFFLNKPTQNVLVVWHPKWAKENRAANLSAARKVANKKKSALEKYKAKVLLLRNLARAARK